MGGVDGIDLIEARKGGKEDASPEGRLQEGKSKEGRIEAMLAESWQKVRNQKIAKG